MSIFICWSGDRSHLLAQALKRLLLGSLPSLRKNDVFISDRIEKGANWFSSIEGELENARAGIVCVTAENLGSPWMHFEAGALVRRLANLPTGERADTPGSPGQPERRRLYPLLHGVTGSQLSGPLSAYQATITTEQDLGEMMRDLARELELPEAGKDGSLVPRGRWKTFERSVDRLSVPARNLVGLSPLFQRKTFNEPIYRCTDQAWVRRYDGARESLSQLAAGRARVQAACSPHERAVFEMLLTELDGYAMAMQSLLLAPRKFKLEEPGELRVDPAIRTCCEDRRLAIRSLATMLMHPLDEPLREEAVRFISAETNEERKMIVHRLEGAIRRHREAVYERSRKGAFQRAALHRALEALTGGRMPIEYRASSWDLDRIYYYLLVQYFTAGVLAWNSNETGLRRRAAGGTEAYDRPREHDWLCAARDIEMEVERYRARSKGGSLMPLTYALCALKELHPEQTGHPKKVASAVQAALDLVEHELGGTRAPEASRAIQQLVRDMRPAERSQAGRRSPPGGRPTAPARAASVSPSAPSRRRLRRSRGVQGADPVGR